MPNTRAGDAFITMLAGYQVYKSKSFSGSSILIGKEKTAQARSASLIASYYILFNSSLFELLISFYYIFIFYSLFSEMGIF